MHDSDERFPPPLCHPGTREVVVRRIIGWYLDESRRKKPIMWVYAPAGYGKTAVAGTVSEKLEALTVELGFCPVGATFFFWRTSQERNSPARFIITLAYQLVRSIPELQYPIDEVINADPMVLKKALEVQLRKLIVEPLRSLSNLDDIPNRLIIVDGIDECINSDRESRLEKKSAEDRETSQLRVLNLIQNLQSHHLPLSFLILSRPEAWIRRHLESRLFCDVMEPLDLYKVGDHMNDVKLFVRAELRRIAKDLCLESVDAEWPKEEALVRKSEGHMIYASTVIRHIDDPYGDPRKLLNDIIYNSSTRPDISSSTPFSSLHELYRQIMRSCPQRNRLVMIEVIEDVMAYQKRRTFVDEGFEEAFRALDSLSGRLPDCGLKALRPLHAVLRIGDWHEQDIGNLFIHATFVEFLHNPDLSEEYAVNPNEGEERTLSNVLDRMTSITMNTLGKELEDPGTRFAVQNWCTFWDTANSGPLVWWSPAAHLNMIKKIIELDLTACVLQSYFIHSRTRSRHSSMAPLFEVLRTGSSFFVESLDRSRGEDTLSVLRKARYHVLSSLDAAFIYFLQMTSLPSELSERTQVWIGRHCVKHLQEVTCNEADWKANKLVCALRNPGNQGTPFFDEMVKCLYDESWPREDQDKRRELLLYIDDAILKVGSEALLHCRNEFWYCTEGQDWKQRVLDRSKPLPKPTGSVMES
ncbi:hypothetical protein EST38_g12104 [Candolleomyces aberdarensis]|uniref:Nephrocystin 3-like N-terminal domain-containing protein n=1 Tax=Candolleomyces aberdarensis TaxID=2316362 RepID=A0A4Q2D5H7_9AGAR|nr:hypothetical protein EST38_g12104 [Candolleomyces aberdarensis]